MAADGIGNPLSYAIEAVQKTRSASGSKTLFEEVKWAAKILFYTWLDFTAGQFDFNGRKYRYFYHPYNNTWRNERCVEVPIAWEEVRGAYAAGKRVLEVGNVLSHYFSIKHDVLDKYEKAPGVKNEDVVDFKAAVLYDLIVSISTMEHVGYDETPKEEGKPLLAFDNLWKNLSPDGKMLFTFGMGYNTAMDRLALNGKPDFVQWSFLKRDRKTRWSQASLEEATGAKFNSPYPFANYLAIGIAQGRGSKGQK